MAIKIDGSAQIQAASIPVTNINTAAGAWDYSSATSVAVPPVTDASANSEAATVQYVKTKTLSTATLDAIVVNAVGNGSLTAFTITGFAGTAAQAELPDAYLNGLRQKLVLSNPQAGEYTYAAAAGGNDAAVTFGAAPPNGDEIQLKVVTIALS
jgi:hypothetical protein